MSPDELLAIARAATPGEWCDERTERDALMYGNEHTTIPAEMVVFLTKPQPPQYKYETATLAGENEKANARHIATFSPARVIALLEFVQAWDARQQFEASAEDMDVFDAIEAADHLVAAIFAARRALDEA